MENTEQKVVESEGSDWADQHPTFIVLPSGMFAEVGARDRNDF